MGDNTALDIIQHIRLRLCKNNSFLAPALGMLETSFSDEIESIGTDGKKLFICSDWLTKIFLLDSKLLEAHIIHQVSHCLLSHPFSLADDLTKYDIDTDIAAWNLTSKILGTDFEDYLGTDNHTPWRKSENLKDHACNSGLGETWHNIAKKVGAGGGKRRHGIGAGSSVFSYVLEPKKRIGYEGLLRHFAENKEVQSPDYDQFQYSCYTYGLELYGSMPIIEPVEYSEEQRIEELVIVIDTSESCSKELTRMFLSETRNILLEQGLFFNRFDLRIIQCDSVIQHIDRLTSVEELSEYIDSLEVRGGGGTDFRPPFEYVETCINKGELSRLKGLLYFTDGYGIYPNSPPSYDTTFIFIEECRGDVDLPDWASKFVLANTN